MRVIARSERKKRRRRRGDGPIVLCAVMSHHERVTARRPHTKLYDKTDRVRLGLSVARAREAAGYPFRPAFEKASGVGSTSLWKLENGDPVGPLVYEAVARALPGWTEDTPRQILEGASPPEPPAGESAPGEPPKPRPEDFESDYEYMLAVYAHLRRSMSHEAVIAGFQMAAAALRNQPESDGKDVG